jgi:propionate CoA-transferase
VLQEIAPGIDLEKDVLAQMDFTPAIQQPLGKMDARIFKAASMGLKGRINHAP